MKKILMYSFLVLTFGFTGAAMSATVTLDFVGDYDAAGHSGLTNINTGSTPDFNITDIVQLNNVQAVLKIGAGELNNIIDFISYKIFSDIALTNQIAQFNFYNVSNGGDGSVSSAGFSTGILSPGTYYLNATGRTTGPALSGSFANQVTAMATPIPAAIWLLGSALIGLVGMSRRKAGLAA